MKKKMLYELMMNVNAYASTGICICRNTYTFTYNILISFNYFSCVREHLKNSEKLGEGAFGSVIKVFTYIWLYIYKMYMKYK
jgi:hypothetical protein